MTLLQREQQQARLRTLEIVRGRNGTAFRPIVHCDRKLTGWRIAQPKTVLT